MEDEIKTVDASVEEAPVEEVKPKKRGRKKTAKVIEDTPTEVVEEVAAESEVEPVVQLNDEVSNDLAAEETPASSEVEIVEDVKDEFVPVEDPDKAAEQVIIAPITEEAKSVDEKAASKKAIREAKKEKIEVSPDVQIEVAIDWDKAVNKFFIAKRQISIFRAPNSIANGKPFVGRLQIVGNTNDLFVKVRYVRSGLGATYGYARKSQIIQTGCEIG